MELSLDEIIRANPDNFKVKNKINKGKPQQRTTAVQTPSNFVTTMTGLRRRNNNVGVSTNTPKKQLTTQKVVVSKKLLLTNLESAVTDHDLHELFSDFGEIESVRVHYDKVGRSLGIADIVFKRPADALEAKNQYNGVPLDGQIMHIEMVGASGGAVVGGNAIANRVGSSNLKKSFKPRNNAPKKRAKRMRSVLAAELDMDGDVEMKDAVTAEDLDAEMDDYIKMRDLHLLKIGAL